MTSKILKFIDIFINKNGYLVVLQGLKNTMYIAIAGLLIGVAIGTLIATVRVLPKYSRLSRFLNGICSFYVGLFRGTPMVVQLLVFYYVMLPLLGVKMLSVNVAMCVFGLNSGAYISEIMRAGILSVDGGQLEGARSVGLSYSASMIKIVIPQAIKNILPALGNEFIALVKETSVVSFVGALDLYRAFSNIGDATYEYMVPYLVMALVYIVIVCLITLLVKIMERRLRRSERQR
ncbi:MAG: amino acid ABC transporter permease [Acutalibacteraceae bacterium]